MAESRPSISHAQNDARYVEQGKRLFPKDPGADEDLKTNRKKNGRPFLYPVSTVMMAAAIRCLCKLSLRASEGLAVASLGTKDAPGHTTLHKRIERRSR